MNKIALLKGGNGSEKDISLMTAEACKKAFKELGFKFVEIDIKNEYIQNLIIEDIDTCFNALHGSLGENGSIPGLLNCLKIPYTHSGVQASCISINKSLTKYILSKQGIKFPKALDLNIDEYITPINFNSNYVINLIMRVPVLEFN